MSHLFDTGAVFLVGMVVGALVMLLFLMVVAQYVLHP